jgi:hypothetical protein
MEKGTTMFDVALSFAGEDRKYVEEVASILRDMGIRIFYDKYEIATLWGKDLYAYLDEIYQKRAKYTVMFISQHYADKLWTNHERKSAQARAFSKHEEYILPARFDETEIPGILTTIGYVDLREISPIELAEMIKNKVGPIQRVEFFPKNPDRLYAHLKISDPNEIRKVYTIAEHFYEALKLMTPAERHVLATAVCHTCIAGPPKNIHLNIEYLGRLVSLTRDEITSLFARLDCLHIVTRVYETDHKKDEDVIKKTKEIIEIKYEPLLEKYGGNATNIMIAVFQCIFDDLCPNCAKGVIDRVDLSILGTLTGFSEGHTAQGSSRS